MYTSKRNPLDSPKDEQYDRHSTQPVFGKLVPNKTKLIKRNASFPALNPTKNFATFTKKLKLTLKSNFLSRILSNICHLVNLKPSTLFVKLNEHNF